MQDTWFFIVGLVIGGLSLNTYFRVRISDVQSELADLERDLDEPVPERVRSMK